MQYSEVEFTDVTIANGGTTSGNAALGRGRLFGVSFPAAMTGTTLGFEVDVNSSWKTLTKDTGSAYTITVTAGAYVPVEWLHFAAARSVRVVSNAAEGAERTITLVSRPA